MVQKDVKIPQWANKDSLKLHNVKKIQKHWVKNLEPLINKSFVIIFVHFA